MFEDPRHPACGMKRIFVGMAEEIAQITIGIDRDIVTADQNAEAEPIEDHCRIAAELHCDGCFGAWRRCGRDSLGRQRFNGRSGCDLGLDFGLSIRSGRVSLRGDGGFIGQSRGDLAKRRLLVMTERPVFWRMTIEKRRLFGHLGSGRLRGDPEGTQMDDIVGGGPRRRLGRGGCGRHELFRFGRNETVDMDDAEAAIAVETPVEREGRQTAEAHRHSSRRAGDRPQNLDAAERLSFGESPADGSLRRMLEIFRHIAEVAAEQIRGSRADHFGERRRDLGDLVFRIGAPEKAHGPLIGQTAGENISDRFERQDRLRGRPCCRRRRLGRLERRGDGGQGEARRSGAKRRRDQQRFGVADFLLADFIMADDISTAEKSDGLGDWPEEEAQALEARP